MELPLAVTADENRGGGRCAVDGIVDVFNLLNRANYTEINNIFGTGAFSSAPQKDAQGRVTGGSRGLGLEIAEGPDHVVVDCVRSLMPARPADGCLFGIPG